MDNWKSYATFFRPCLPQSCQTKAKPQEKANAGALFPGFRLANQCTTRSVDHELGFRFPEDTFDFKFRKVQLLVPSNFGKVQYHIT